MHRPATSKQTSEILRLARELDGGSYRFVEQARHLLPLSNTAIRSLTLDDASLCIDHLKAEIERKEQAVAQPAVESAPTAADMIAMLGRQVAVTFTDGDEKSGTVTSIKPSPKDGTPALVLDGGSGSYRTSAIASWTIV